MEKKGEPNPRFKEFTEVKDQEGKVIGFSIPESTFIFKYDSSGGWVDQDGRYYNAYGIQQYDEQQEDIDDLQEDDQSQSDIDEQLIDEFQDMLRKQEQGYVKPVPKKAQEVVQPSPPVPNKERDLTEKDFEELLSRYLKKQHLKDNLPGELFIYFKQKAKNFEPIKPQIERIQSVENKNKHMEDIIEGLAQKRQSLITSDKWLEQPEVFLDFSGQSEVPGEYERYWYGRIKTSADKYLQFIKHIIASEGFYLLQNKTYFALKSKFYLKKSEEKIKDTIKELSSKVQSLAENQAIVIKLDNLPQFFPLSTVYDLVEYVNGNPEDIQLSKVIDQYSCQLTVAKDTALKIINLQAYNHDKGLFIQVSLKQPTELKTSAKNFYSISIQGAYKLHERQLNDTLALRLQIGQLAKHLTQSQENEKKVRFILGSFSALKKVLMFRSQSLNVLAVQHPLTK